jgi:hypothetical protein
VITVNLPFLMHDLLARVSPTLDQDYHSCKPDILNTIPALTPFIRETRPEFVHHRVR